MTDIEFVSHSSVTLVRASGNDFDVAKAAWVSNYGDEAPEGIHNLLMSDPEYHWPLTLKSENYSECYGEFKESLERVRGLINFLYRERHMSPFEHGSMTFLVETPLFVRSEFHRHRTWSYNEMSGRYKELEPKFWIGKDVRIQKGKVGAYRFEPGTAEQDGIYMASKEIAVKAAWDAYQARLNAGIAKEQAREELPLSTMTKFYATANPRNIMQFLQLRNDDNALLEIREVAQKIEDIFANQYPLTYDAYTKYDYREEKKELDILRKRVAQYEAAETYPEFNTTGGVL